MFRPPAFNIDDQETIRAFMREQSFALLVTNVDGVPFASHIPLLLEDSGKHGRLSGHLSKGNSQWQGFDGDTEALVVFWGPHAYVSPSWYEAELNVPTWNYATVHAYGRPTVIDDPEAIRRGQADMVGYYESDATDNWSMDRLPESYIEKMLNGIVAFEMPIERLEGKFKLSQNRTPADRAGAIKGLRETGNAEAAEVARLMAEILPND